MIRSLALVAGIGAATALAGCDLSSINLDGVDSTELRTVDDFQSIDLRGSADVVVVVGGSQRVEITTDTAAQRKVDTYVQNGTLVIDTFGGKQWSNVPVDVAISVPSLDGFNLSGAGDVLMRGIHGDTFTLTIDGAGDVEVTGSTDVLRVSLDGAGDVNAKQLTARYAVADLSGAGNISVNATDRLDASIDGVGVIDYVGAPRVTKSVSGAGHVGPA